jgi:signal transduction histidine kinase
LLSFIVVRWITKPISTLAVAADELGRDIQRSPLEENGPREVAQAAHAFNIMQSRINQYIQDRSQLLAAISHDLRTPITRLRLRTELLNNEALKKKFLGDLEDMQTMVNETLDYMRGHDRKEAIQKIDINALVDSLVEDMRDAGHQMNIEGKSQKVYRGRPLALKRCLTNLLENAIRYGENASIWIEESEKNLILRIIDTGPGIPQDQLDKIFEPFFRLDSSRNRSSGGVGLGLGIARDIARANGGDLYLRNPDKGGLEAVLELPNSLTSVSSIPSERT